MMWRAHLLETVATAMLACACIIGAAHGGQAGETAMKHFIVYAQKDTFAGWPANNGVWSWEGKEILVGCSVGPYRVQEGHNITEPIRSALCRSLDGGETWRVEFPANYVGQSVELSDPPAAIDFAHPDFAMRVIGMGYHGTAQKRGGFFVSYDRGKTWQGPYRFGALGDQGELADMELTPRTDYLVNGPADCMVFLSARRGGFSDRTFCVRTTDAGATFRFVSWMVGPSDPNRAVMPSTVRCPDGKLLSAIRRRNMPGKDCWIDLYRSTDDGRSWSFLSKVGETGGHNGNPPALVRLRDGRLCCVYGQRERRAIIARFSPDEGTSWGQEQVIRDGYASFENDADLGYPRLVQRADGRLVAMYYWATREQPCQHIAATIWDPQGAAAATKPGAPTTGAEGGKQLR
jgi:hypothetical protein